MRIRTFGGILTTALLANPTLAQVSGYEGHGAGPGSIVRPTPGATLLTVRDRGMQVSRPDFASQLIVLTTRGFDNGSAITANQQLIAQVKKITATLGIDPSAVQILQSEATSRFGFIGNEAFEANAGLTAETQKPQPKSFASSSMLVWLTDINKLGPLRTQLQAISELQLNNPLYGLNDDSSAKRAAIDQALAKARIDSAIFAKAMNMKVDQISAVRNVVGAFGPDSFSEMMAERGQLPVAGVRTEVWIEVDTVLKPL